jgi:hypothetical protein
MKGADELESVESVKQFLAGAAESETVARASCLDCANKIGLAWAPVLTAEERRYLWYPVFVVAGAEYSVPILCDAMMACSCPEEAIFLADALAVVLQHEQTRSERLFSSSLMLQLLPSLPDRCANATQALRPIFFEQQRYFAWLARHITVVLILEPARQDLSVHAATVASKMCSLGPVAVKSLVKSWSSCSETMIVERIAPVMRMVGRAEKLLPEVLASFDTARFFAVSHAMLEDATARHVLECALLVGRTLPVGLARRLVSMHCMRGTDAALALARDLAKIWSDSHFAKYVDEALQLQVTRALRFLIDSCGRDGARAIIPSLLAGVHERLGLPEGGRRRLAMSLAQHTSRLAAETSEPLDFGEEGLDDLLEWEVDAEVVIQEEPAGERDDLLEASRKEDPDSRIVEFEDEDDEDSLSSFEIEDEETVAPKERRPVYLRDCLKCIQEGKRKVESMELGLNAAEELIRAQPVDLDDVCVPLASALLHASNEFSLPRFVEIRSGAVVALLVCAPVKVAEFVGTQFASPNWSIQQRMDMLDAAHDAILELSHGQHQRQQEEQQQQISLNVVGEKSRRWGSAVPGRGPKQVLANRFKPELAGSFFWPFQNALRPSFVSTLDVLVLAKLMLYLGKVVAATPSSPMKMRMLVALADGVWIHRWHPNEHVARSCMIGLVEALLSVQPPSMLLETSAELLSEAVNWFTDVAREGLTRETTEVARACASELARHLQHENKLVQE